MRSSALLSFIYNGIHTCLHKYDTHHSYDTLHSHPTNDDKTILLKYLVFLCVPFGYSVLLVSEHDQTHIEDGIVTSLILAMSVLMYSL